MARFNRRHKFSLASFILFLLIIVATQSGWLSSSVKRVQQNDPSLYPVARFDDGDTIVVNMAGHDETIRFIGVDTPETHRPNTPVQCFGPEASSYTKQLIGSSKVRLQADPLDTNRDRYGRLLRYVSLPDGTLVEDRLISGGYGFAYTQFPFQKKQQFIDEETAARNSKLGLWAACQVHSESGREQTNAL